jgi:hypothetical protein
MGITPQFSQQEILRSVEKTVQKIDAYVLNELEFIGLEFVRNARIKADFTDRTGNLRSSIGYIIIKQGNIIKEDFELSNKGSDRSTGKAKGIEYAKGLPNPNIGYVLIVVAGMEYAVYVEAKGYDVLTGSGNEAEKSLKEAIKSVKQTFGKK